MSAHHSITFESRLLSRKALDECPICLEDMEAKTVVIGHLVQDSLMHMVHRKCWEAWAKRQDTVAGDRRTTYTCVYCQNEFRPPSYRKVSFASIAAIACVVLAAIPLAFCIKGVLYSSAHVQVISCGVVGGSLLLAGGAATAYACRARHRTA